MNFAYFFSPPDLTIPREPDNLTLKVYQFLGAESSVDITVRNKCPLSDNPPAPFCKSELATAF